MASAECCAAGAPVVAVDYTPVGKIIEPEFDRTLRLYVSGSGTRCLLQFTDLFGVDFNQNFQIADKLASSCGMMVAVVDVFNGKPWPKDGAFPPPGGFKEILDWIFTNFPWDKIAPKCNDVVKYLTDTNGVKEFVSLGMCLGAWYALEMAAAGQVVAAGGCHPSLFNKDVDIATRINVPCVLLPAKGDPMEKLKEVWDTKPFAAQCVYRRFDDQDHGYMGSRGDWANANISAAVNETLEILTKFYTSIPSKA